MQQPSLLTLKGQATKRHPQISLIGCWKKKETNCSVIEWSHSFLQGDVTWSQSHIMQVGFVRVVRTSSPHSCYPSLQMFLSVSPPSCFHSFSTFCCFHQRRHRHTSDFESRRGCQSRSRPRPQSGRGPFYMVALLTAALYVCWTYVYLSISFLSSRLLDFTLSLTRKRAPSPSSLRRSPTLPAARARKPRPAMVRSHFAPGVMPLEASVAPIRFNRHYAAPKGFPNVPLLFPQWTRVHQPIRKNHNVMLEIYIHSFLAFLAFLDFLVVIIVLKYLKCST